MSSKQQSATESLVFLNVDFDESRQNLLQDLRQHYSGINNVVKLYHQDNDGKFIRAIQIDMKSSKLAHEFIDQSRLCFFNKDYAIQTLTQSLIVSKVGSTVKSQQIFQDLTHNYLGVERISRFYGADKNMVDQIRIDFKSESTVTKIIKDDYIFIDGKRRPVQPYRSLIYIPNENDLASQQPATNESSKPVSKNSQNYLTETRVKELFKQQQMQLEAMINQFENKWNARFSSLTASSTNANTDQLLSIFKDLSTVCQQYNQQNANVQRQLGALVHRTQDVQMKLNEGEQKSQLPMQNGH